MKTTTRATSTLAGLLLTLVVGIASASARELHVSPSGDDAHDGSAGKTLKTISAAAAQAQPGDVITVHEGVYREEIKPPRGGTKTQPIVYKAAEGEEVSIRGSERVTHWSDLGGGVWKVELADSFFGGFNPFTVNVAGAWLSTKAKEVVVVKNREPSKHSILHHHLGDVYLNGQAYREKFSLAEVKENRQSWYCQNKDGQTTIWANFGEHDPNRNMAEVNARSTAIFPEKSGLKYLVIDGFDIRHTASQWSDIYSLEEGAIGMKYGYGWVIQNCRISDSRNNGISMGVSDEVHFSYELTKGGDNIPPYGSFGFHIIRNNIIKRSGQCGIYGCYGAVGTLIENNEISETVYRKEWAGPNQADIKILFPIDVTIRNNKFYGPNGCGRAVWLDWGSQNARITGNLIIDRRDGIFTEVSFGPTIVDNNLFIRSGVRDWSDGNIYAHNLFYQSPMFHLMGEPGRPFVPYYKPHSTEQAGRNETKLRHERWYNNLFIGGNSKKTPKKLKDTSGFLVNNNVYLDGEPRFPFEGGESIVDDLKSELEFQNNPETASIQFNLSELPFKGTYPLITSKMIGKMPLPQVFMENQDGTPLDVTTDYFGSAIDPKNVKPGPFQKMAAGGNKFTVWPHPSRKDK